MKTNHNTEEVSKKEAVELAEILIKIQQLPKEERIAMQYYIKGTLQRIQMTGENSKLIGT